MATRFATRAIGNNSRAESREITEEMIRLFNSGTWKVQDIAARWGVTSTAVQLRMRAAGYRFVRRVEPIHPEDAEPAPTECIHGEKLAHNCNGCSDRYGHGYRMIRQAP